MGRRFIVKIALDAVVKQLSAADGTDYTVAYVRQWLQDAGFTPRGEEWLVTEENLGHLQPSEVLAIRPADEAD